MEAEARVVRNVEDFIFPTWFFAEKGKSEGNSRQNKAKQKKQRDLRTPSKY